MLWIRREIGDELFKEVETHGWKWALLRSESQTVPGDIYCRCDIYVDTDNNKHSILFPLKYPNAICVEKIK